MKGSKVLERLSRLNILLVSQPDEQGQSLARELQRTRAAVERRWPCPEKVGVDCDMVVCDFFAGIERRYPWVPGEATAAIVLLLPVNGSTDPDAIHAALPNALLTRPVIPSAVVPALSLAWDHFSYHRRQSTRINQLDENIRVLRDVERAKTILMEERKISEISAFESLWKEAMEKRTKISTIAKWIVDSRDRRVWRYYHVI